MANMRNQFTQKRFTPRRFRTGDIASSARQQLGVVTTEFVLSIVLISGVAVALFALSYTLVVVEVTQYIAFSVARAHAVAHRNPDLQKEVAESKYQALISKPPISHFFKGQWFEIAKPTELQIKQGLNPDDNFASQIGNNSGGNNYNRFQGVMIRLVPKIMNFKIPLIGNTNPDGEDEAFATNINGLLIREPTAFECQEYFKNRNKAEVWRSLMSDSASGIYQIKDNDFANSEDNGC